MTSISKNKFIPATNTFNSFILTTIQKHSKIIITALVALGFLAVAYALLTRNRNTRKMIPTPPNSRNGTSTPTPSPLAPGSLPLIPRSGLTHSTPSSSSGPQQASRDIKACFPSEGEAKAIISQRDRFLTELSPFDRQIRMKGRTPCTEENFIDYYAAQYRTPSPDMQGRLNTDLQGLSVELRKYHIDLCTEINFIQTTGLEEIPGTWAYCRGNTIFFNNLPKGLLAHELFHIYSSHHPEMRRKLYAIIGYEVCNPISLPDSLTRNRIVNPDAPLLDAFIRIRYMKKSTPEIPEGTLVQAVPVDFYDPDYRGPGRSSFLQGIYHKFVVVETGEDGVVRVKLDGNNQPYLFDFQGEAGNLYEQIGDKSYNDGPEEILAEYFTDILMGNAVILKRDPRPDAKKKVALRIINAMERCFLEAAH